MPDAPTLEQEANPEALEAGPADLMRARTAVSFGEIGGLLVRRRRFVLWTMGVALAACLLYCLVTPDEYEAQARVALRATPVSALSLEGSGETAPGAFASGEIQLETLADVFRSDALAWSVIENERLYQAPGFMGRFARRFPGFRPKAPGPDAQAYLLERFRRRLKVETLPRTLIVQIRFRSRDAALSARVVNALIRAYREQDAQTRVTATSASTGWLDGQLGTLKAQIEGDGVRLMEFEKAHGLLDSPGPDMNGQAGSPQTEASLEIEELGRDLASATAERMLREAEYHAAMQGDPELVMAADPKLLGEGGASALSLMQQLHIHRSDLEQEQAQLSAEHGPNFPRTVEIRGQLAEIDQQIKAEEAKLTERLHDAWKVATDREALAKANLDHTTRQGMQLNEAATQAALMRAEMDRNHELYMQLMQKREEAGVVAGVGSSNVSVIDFARQPAKPVSPDLPVYTAITFFVSLWVALGGVFLMESVRRPGVRGVAALVILALMFSGSGMRAQAPTPSTSGLPTGVARIPQSEETRSQPNAKDAPTVWGSGQGVRTGTAPDGGSAAAAAVAVAIGAGDLLDVSEFHTPGVHTVVRVSGAGTIELPLAGEVQIGGMNESVAARAIEKALVARGMLLHPQVNVLVTAYAGRDVSVLGEVTRPGVYAYTEHHRLLDLIAAAQGLTPTAGSLVTIVHRDQPDRPQAVVLDPGAEPDGEHNPLLDAGDTVEVSRAGLVYVIGDVIRPGGFPVDPVQRLTVVKALALAWGPGQNAALSKGLLIREQKGGRTLTTLNLKRLLHGQDPDLPIEDHDILFVPDSTAKNLWNRSMESVIQSVAGVSIYAGLVYSQRF